MAEDQGSVACGLSPVSLPRHEQAGSATPSGDTQYRGYTITYDPPPIPVRSCDWQFTHRDYDGPEDRRCGHAGSLAEAKAEIDMLEDE